MPFRISKLSILHTQTSIHLSPSGVCYNVSHCIVFHCVSFYRLPKLWKWRLERVSSDKNLTLFHTSMHLEICTMYYFVIDFEQGHWKNSGVPESKSILQPQRLSIHFLCFDMFITLQLSITSFQSGNRPLTN